MHLLGQFFHYITLPVRLLFSSPTAIFSAPRRLLGMSLPTRVAILVAIALMFGTIAAYVMFLLGPEYLTDRKVWLTWRRIVPIVSLLIVIPLVVHHAMKLWLEGETSRFPDVDTAWRQGIDALKEQGIELSETPVFLVLGVANDAQARALFSASKIGFNVQDVPPGPAAMHWYANADSIFLCCTKSCSLSLLASRATDDTGQAALLPPPSSGGQDNIRGTIIAGGADVADSQDAWSPESGEPAPSDSGPPGIQATMDIGRFIKGGADAPEGAASGGGLKRLLSKEADEQSQRLHYVCQLLRRARDPICPINGILNLLPFHVIQQGDAHGSEVQVAAKVDLTTIRNVIQLRCPVVAIVSGMETQSGFRELVRRVGLERAAVQRFGKGYGVWSPPAPEEIEAVVANACGAFEDWAYALFRDRDGLKKKGNTHLYALLCQIRNRLQSRLCNILVGAYAYDPDTDSPDQEPLLFSGCYFAATGEQEDRQAFVKSVFQKLIEQENELDWTKSALAEDARYQALANSMMVLSGLLILGSLGMVVYRIGFWN